MLKIRKIKNLNSIVRGISNEDSVNKVVSFYDEEIQKYSSKQIKPVTLQDLIKFGKPPLSKEKLILSANYCINELPNRLARRVESFQKLPYIVGTNPHLVKIYKLYYQSFKEFLKFTSIKTEKEDVKFTEFLTQIVEQHKDVIPVLAQGFLECKEYFDEIQITSFLNNIIQARIGIRLIAEQHIALHKNEKNYIGIIKTNLSPKDLIIKISKQVEELCNINYGISPKVDIKGDLDTKFQYVPVHLEYIALELLKNSYRATVEYYQKQNNDNIPNVEVIIIRNKTQIYIRFRDQGGGISSKNLSNVFRYSYTSVQNNDEENLFDFQSKLDMQTNVGGPLAGLGYGLPMARIYSQYFGGSLEIESVYGHGTDVYLNLKNIDEDLYSTDIN